MVNTYNIYKKIKDVFNSEEIANTLTEVISETIIDYDKIAKKEDIQRLEVAIEKLSDAQLKTEIRLNKLAEKVNELAEVQKRTEERVNELAEAQAKTEERLDKLTERVNELAEAQKRTEQRINELAEAQKRTEQRINELAEAQKRTEQRVNELAEAQKRTEQRVNELAEAQKRTEQRINELAEAQKKTEQKVNELAEAQKRTEEEVRKLTIDHNETRKQLDGLVLNVGFHLENISYKSLPSLLKRDYGIEVKDRLIRTYLPARKGMEVQINIYGIGEKEGKIVTIIGESKIQLSKKHIDEFIRKKLELVKIEGNIFPLLVTHMTSSSDVINYAKEKGIAVYFSYDLE